MKICLPFAINNFVANTGFIQRKRNIKTHHFLELLFSEPGNITEKLFLELSSALEDSGVIISKQGLDKKYNKL